MVSFIAYFTLSPKPLCLPIGIVLRTNLPTLSFTPQLVGVILGGENRGNFGRAWLFSPQVHQNPAPPNWREKWVEERGFDGKLPI